MYKSRSRRQHDFWL